MMAMEARQVLTHILRERSGDETQFGFCRLTDNPPQFGCNAVQLARFSFIRLE